MRRAAAARLTGRIKPVRRPAASRRPRGPHRIPKRPQKGQGHRHRGDREKDLQLADPARPVEIGIKTITPIARPRAARFAVEGSAWHRMTETRYHVESPVAATRHRTARISRRTGSAPSAWPGGSPAAVRSPTDPAAEESRPPDRTARIAPVGTPRCRTLRASAAFAVLPLCQPDSGGARKRAIGSPAAPNTRPPASRPLMIVAVRHTVWNPCAVRPRFAIL